MKSLKKIHSKDFTWPVVKALNLYKKGKQPLEFREQCSLHLRKLKISVAQIS